jgi:hypothetical protein
MDKERLGRCVNPGCGSAFKRLGTGKIYSLHVNDPQAWGLPAHVRQKVVWLCSKCSSTKHVKFDRVHCQVLIVSKSEQLHVA